MKKITVNLEKQKNDSYDLLIDNGLFEHIPSILKTNKLGNKYLIITDDVVAELYGNKLYRSLRKANLEAYILHIKQGEKNKNFKTYTELIEKSFSFRLDRQSVIISLGGGVIGDIAGFVAATYMRGIKLIHVPTTLLAQVDSSIGGKVAVDLKAGKNIVGCFHQPSMVIIDPLLLKSLPREELLCGLAEVIKHSIIRDRALFDYIDKNITKILLQDAATILHIISRSCNIKATIVSLDEKEHGLRKILNYGHTIAHAIETITKYKKYKHGQAVALGMAIEAKISSEMKLMSREQVILQNALLEKAGFTLKAPNISMSKLLSQIMVDKKAISNKLLFVLPKQIGDVASKYSRYTVEVPDKIIQHSYNSFI